MRSIKIGAYSVSVFLSLLMLLMWAASSQADPVEDFYRSKQVRFITAYSAGGLFDTATPILVATSANLSPESRACGSII